MNDHPINVASSNNTDASPLATPMPPAPIYPRNKLREVKTPSGRLVPSATIIGITVVVSLICVFLALAYGLYITKTQTPTCSSCPGPVFVYACLSICGLLLLAAFGVKLVVQLQLRDGSRLKGASDKF